MAGLRVPQKRLTVRCHLSSTLRVYRGTQQAIVLAFELISFRPWEQTTSSLCCARGGCCCAVGGRKTMSRSQR